MTGWCLVGIARIVGNWVSCFNLGLNFFFFSICAMITTISASTMLYCCEAVVVGGLSPVDLLFFRFSVFCRYASPLTRVPILGGIRFCAVCAEGVHSAVYLPVLFVSRIHRALVKLRPLLRSGIATSSVCFCVCVCINLSSPNHFISTAFHRQTSPHHHHHQQQNPSSSRSAHCSNPAPSHHRHPHSPAPQL